MPADRTDTIVAAACAPGGAGGLIRFSGPTAGEIARRLTGADLPARRAVAVRLPIGLEAEAVWMPAPHTYTGEDTVEWHLPGAAPVLDAAVEAMVAAGARPAGPGEFTLRAYLNGRLELGQAEAVAAVIDAADAPELRAAQRALRGQLSGTLRRVESDLLDLCAEVEAAIDFVDQDIELIAPTAVVARTRSAHEALSALRDGAVTRRPRESLPRVMLLGPPNAGKTTLLNALAGRPVAIASPIRGTTRDLLSATVRCGDVIVELLDAPGILDESAGVEARAIERALEAARGADLVLLVAGVDEPIDPASWARRIPDGVQTVRVLNKCDLAPAADTVGIAVSALRGDGLDTLRTTIARALSGGASADGATAVSARQMEALQTALAALDRARDPHAALEILAADLREAASALGALTGREVTDDVLGRIFGRFCIGK